MAIDKVNLPLTELRKLSERIITFFSEVFGKELVD